MPSLYISELIPEFLKFMKVERNLSDRTITEYKLDLKRFTEHMIRTSGKELRLEKISATCIRDYLSYLQLDKGLKTSSLRRNIASIKSFFDFCVLREYLEQSPTVTIQRPKMAKRLPIYLTDVEVKKILIPPVRNEFEKPQDYAKSMRDYAIVITLCFTGMRLSELQYLDIDNIDFEKKIIRILGKGNKERLIPINKIVEDALNRYFEVRTLVESRAVFLNRFKKRLSGRSIESIVSKYIALKGIAKSGITPHKLRHTFATLLHSKKVDIIEIQRLLGHAALTSTQIYAHTNTERLISAVEKLEDL